MEKAEIIIKSNCIFDHRIKAAFPGFLALKGGIIIARGEGSDWESLCGKDTKLFNYRENLVVPGFHDFHTHLYAGTLAQISAALGDAKSEEECAERVASHAASHREDYWILGYGWYNLKWQRKEFPSRHSLDRALRYRPVFLISSDYHSAWLNSKALEICGITAHTPDPPSGRIVRDETGNPTGVLLETAMALAVQQAYGLPQERRSQLMLSLQRKAHSYGVTSLSDMMVLPGFTLDDSQTYASLQKEERLLLRIYLEDGLSEDLSRAWELKNRFSAGLVRFSGLKGFLDGVPANYTSLFLDPYWDRPDTCGSSLISREKAEELIEGAHLAGFRVRLHSCGDGSLRMGLDCLERAIRLNGRKGLRHTLEHVELINPQDIPRFASLGIIASLQPEHLAAAPCFKDNHYRHRVGPERERYLWLNNSLVKSGAAVAYSSDFPVVDLNPLLGIYRAVTRIHDDGEPSGGLNPAERVSLGTALDLYTRGGAYGVGREAETGELLPGKIADIAVFDRNLFSCPSAELREARVILTIFNGRVVWEE